MSLSDDLRRMADRVTELERECEHARTIGPALDRANDYAQQLEQELDERDERDARIAALAHLRGLSEQARQALEMAQEYLNEGDDIASSRRLQDALLAAVAATTESKAAA